MHRKVPARLATMLGLAAIVAGLALFVGVVGAVSHDDRGPRLDAAAIGAPSSEPAPMPTRTTVMTSEKTERKLPSSSVK